MTDRIPEKCSHGVALVKEATCPACEIVWHEFGLAAALKAVERHTRKIAEARAALATTTETKTGDAS